MRTLERQSSPGSRCRTAAIAAVLLSNVLMASCASIPVQSRAEREVLVGGLFSLTGDWSTLGKTGQAALELAVDDVNRYLTGNPANVRFVAAVEDTRLDPALALEKARALRMRGAQLLIGPQSSAEVAHLKSFVDANDMFLVSPSSTAGNLAIPNDNIFRFTPSDSLESIAVSALMWSDGARVVIPVWRDDAGNTGLAVATRSAFRAMGGTVLDGVKYAGGTTDFRAIVGRLRAEVRQATERYGSARVAVYLAGFDEVTALFTNASAEPILGRVRWYGTDGMARSASLLSNRRAAEFAMRVGYPNPLFGLDPGARDVWQPLSARIIARTKLQPDAFALSVYDAVWVVARGYIASGARVETEQLKAAFTTAASTHFGATGWTVLNASGDRKYGDFDFWAVQRIGGVPTWVRVAQFETRTGRIVRAVDATLVTSSR